MSSSQPTSQPSISIYDYPEHLNPFNSDNTMNSQPQVPQESKSSSKESKHKFWTFGRSRKKRSNSFSLKSTWWVRSPGDFWLYAIVVIAALWNKANGKRHVILSKFPTASLLNLNLRVTRFMLGGLWIDWCLAEVQVTKRIKAVTVTVLCVTCTKMSVPNEIFHQILARSSCRRETRYIVENFCSILRINGVREMCKKFCRMLLC